MIRNQAGWTVWSGCQLAALSAFVGFAFAEAPASQALLPLAGSYELPAIASVSDRVLRNADGELEPWLGLRTGEAAVVSLVYTTCPHACPAATATLQRLDAELAKRATLRDRVHLVTISFDPTRDTPERMRAYRAALHPKSPSNWHFLTAASPGEIRPLLDDLGQQVQALFGPDGRESPLLRHVLRVYLIDDQRAIRNIYSSGFLTAEVLLLDLETLLLRPNQPDASAKP